MELDTKGKRLKINVILTVVFLMIFQVPATSGSAAENAAGQGCLLPWPQIAEQVRRGARFLPAYTTSDAVEPERLSDDEGGLEAGRDYAHRPGAPAIIDVADIAAPADSLSKVDVRIRKWGQGAWQVTGAYETYAKAGRIKLNDIFGEAGFYELSYCCATRHAEGNSRQGYAIVCKNWKADILAFCRRLKECIESDRDSTPGFSSITVSHFDHAMEMVSGSSILSGQIVSALADAVQSNADLPSGRCPELVTGGLNKIRFRRFDGAETAEFVVFVPENYNASRSWPVLLNTDARRREERNNYGRRSGMVDVWWHIRGYSTFDWKDYEYFMHILSEKLTIDEERIYVYGLCGNGIGAMALALNRPDQWAGCISILGNSYRDLACNAFNLPLMYVPGGHSQDYRISSYNFALQGLLYCDCRNLEYDLEDGEREIIERFRDESLPCNSRQRHPARVVYRTKSLGNPEAYWVKVLGRENENFAAGIDAHVEGQTIFVRTDNIAAYSLELSKAPVNCKTPVTVIEDGKTAGRVTGPVFTRQPESYKDAKYLKNTHLHGPVWDAFTDPYVVVWGSGGDKDLSAASKRIAGLLANGAPCFSDANMPENSVETHNLILVGTAGSNAWLSKIAEHLPVRNQDNHVVAGGKRYAERDTGYMVIHPNPLNPSRYALVFSSTSAAAMSKMYDAYLQTRSIQPADATVFSVTSQGDIKWHIAERFNTVWSWHEQWEERVCTAQKEHSKWRWAQWVAGAVRKQLKADVAIFEAPFRPSAAVPVGAITYRDLFNVLRNDWVVKIRLNGDDLRSLVTEPSTGSQKSKVSGRIVDGLMFAGGKQGSEHTTLKIAEIEDSKRYTLCFPEGIATEVTDGINYEITAEGYVLSLLISQFSGEEKLDIDDELAGIKVNIF